MLGRIQELVRLEPIGRGEVAMTFLGPDSGGLSGMVFAQRVKVSALERTVKHLDEIKAWIVSVIAEAKKKKKRKRPA
mgnify:FL=1